MSAHIQGHTCTRIDRVIDSSSGCVCVCVCHGALRINVASQVRRRCSINTPESRDGSARFSRRYPPVRRSGKDARNRERERDVARSVVSHSRVIVPGMKNSLAFPRDEVASDEISSRFINRRSRRRRSWIIRPSARPCAFIVGSIVLEIVESASANDSSIR